MAKSLDAEVAAFRSRPLDEGHSYPYLWLDALAVKTREEGRIVRVAVVLATAVSADGVREILGLDVFTSEDEAAWSAFLADLTSRGLSGVALVISDDHRGLTRAIDAQLPGAAWQRCRTHFMRNLLCRLPKSAQPFVATLVRTIFAQPSAEEVAAQLERVQEQLARRFPAAELRCALFWLQRCVHNGEQSPGRRPSAELEGRVHQLYLAIQEAWGRQGGTEA